jgi:hypothetical protein
MAPTTPWGAKKLGKCQTSQIVPITRLANGLQAEAGSFAFYLLIELVLGGIFIALSFRTFNQRN